MGSTIEKPSDLLPFSWEIEEQQNNNKIEDAETTKKRLLELMQKI